MENVDYTASALALNLHSFPHIDMTFQNVNSTFDPEYYRYREAIMFWGIVPIVWMFVTMLVVVMYFCYRCCQRDVKKAGPCLKWTIAILALLSTGAVGAGFYGNEETHKGLQHFIDASKGVQKTTTQTMHQIASMRDRLNLTVINGIEGLRMIIPQTNNQRKEIKENLDQAKVRVKSIISNILEIDRKTNRINSTQFAQYYAEEYGFYRWLAMVLLLSWMMVLFVILLFAVGKGSKYLMLVFGILSIISLILCWLCAGFHLAISVGLADFCTAPLAYMEQLSEDKTYKEIIKYYVKCDHKLNGNPFKMAIPSTYDNANLANISIHNAIVALTKIVSVAKEKDLIKNKSQEVFNAMDDTVQKLMHLNALVECTNLHKDYIDGISGICHKGLEGIVFLLVSIVLTGVNFTGVVLLTSGSWRSFTSGKPFSAGASEDDGPFMVTPDGGPGVSPSYYRTGAKSLRRASDILFRSFLPGCRPNLLADPSQFKKHVIATPLLENNLSPPGYSNDGNSIGGGGGGGGGSNRMRLAEDNL